MAKKLTLLGKLLPISIALAACAPSPPSSNFVRQVPLQSIEQNLKEAKVWCEPATGDSKADCSQSVGYVLSLLVGENSGIEQCTGWLVAPDVVATNSHCLPEDLKTPGADCSSRMAIKLPAVDGKPEESHICSNIIFASRIERKGSEKFLKLADFALFSLRTKSERPLLKPTRKGVPDGLLANVDSVDPMSDESLQGRLTRRQCKAVKRSTVNSSDFDAYSEVAILFGPDCNVHAGNSGSPLVNANGEVVGLVHGGVLEGTDVYSLVSRDQVESTLERPVFATNLACVANEFWDKHLGQPDPRMCSPESRKRARDQYEASAKDALRERLKNLMRGLYQDWLRGAPTDFVYSSAFVSEQDSLVSLRPNPICQRPSTKSDDASKIKSPSWRVKAKLDPYWRMAVSLEPISGAELSGNTGGAARTGLPCCTETELSRGSTVEMSAGLDSQN